MRTTLPITFIAAVAGLTALACTEGVAPSSDQGQVLAAEQEQLGAMIDSDFGAVGAAPTATGPWVAGGEWSSCRPRTGPSWT